MDRMDFDAYDGANPFSSTTIFTPSKEGSKTTPRYLTSTKSSALKSKIKTNTPSLNATITTNNAPNTPYPLFSPMRKTVKGKRGFTPASSTQPSNSKEHEEIAMETTETPSSSKRKRGLFGNLMSRIFENPSPPSSPSVLSSQIKSTSNVSLSATTIATPLASKRMEKRRKQIEEDKENKLNCSINPNDDEFLKLKEEVAKITDEIQTLKTKRSAATPVVSRKETPLTRSQTMAKGLKEQSSSNRIPSCKSLK